MAFSKWVAPTLLFVMVLGWQYASIGLVKSAFDIILVILWQMSTIATPMPKNINLQKPIMSYNLEFFVNYLGLQNAMAIAKLWRPIKTFDYSMIFFTCKGFIILYQVNPLKKY
jgi:hypothetical protein